MKTVNVVFEDKEFEALVQLKGTKSWHDFLLTLLKGGDVDVSKV
jgi:predicted CopG family antitoxin